MANDTSLFVRPRSGDHASHYPRHVLLSAISCHPNQGSEAGCGWNWVRHLSAFCRVSVLTSAGNRLAIETWLSQHQLPGVRFYYIPMPAPLRLPGFEIRQLYLRYIAWQRAALLQAQRIIANDPVDLAHHLTWQSLHHPIFLQQLPVPLVYGPVGGGEMGSRRFWIGGGMHAALYESARAARMASLRWDPLVELTLRRAARILVTTPETERFIPLRYRAKTHVMPSVGIEASLLECPSAYRTDARHVFGSGRLLHWKGFQLAIRAFADVATRRPAARYTIAGDGAQRARLEGIIRSQGLSDRVHIEPWLPRSDALRLTQESDIFMLPSLHDSGGMAVLEAMAAGKPVVCLDTGGPAVLVSPDCGIKVAVTTPKQVVQDLADAVIHLLADAGLRRCQGQAGRHRVRETFAWEAKAETMLDIYKDVLSARPSRSDDGLVAPAMAPGYGQRSRLAYTPVGSRPR